MVAGVDDYEASSLRQELVLRILLQNVLLVVSLVFFCWFATVVLVFPSAAWPVTFAHSCVSLGAALQWCHHGVRTKQLKNYLQLLAEKDGGAGWEQWLPAHRPSSFLGSRWMVSTKGVFLGLQLAMILLSEMAATNWFSLPAFGSVAVLLSSAGFLLTNPKE